MDAREELREGVRWAEKSLNFDVDVRVHVFELTIRALGGLLSTHSLLVRDSSLVPGEPPLSSERKRHAPTLMNVRSDPGHIPKLDECKSWKPVQRANLGKDLKHSLVSWESSTELLFSVLAW